MPKPAKPSRETSAELADQTPKSGETSKSGVYVLTMKGRRKGVFRKAQTFTKIFNSPSLEKINVIKMGVAPDVLDDLADAMGAPQEVVIRNLGIVKSTWSRKRQQKVPLEKDDSERLMGLAALIGQVAALVEEQGTPEGFDAAKWFYKWIEEPLPALSGKKPAELLDTKEGQQVVGNLIGTIRGGAYQ
jgi:putative toxin-antitoxin system antitoxin component (TIGR02293 family)